MSETTGAPLGAVLADLGSTILEVVIGRIGAERTVSTVVIYDPYDPSLIEPGALVLGVGISTGAGLDDLLAILVERSASALILREPVEIGLDAATTAEDGDVPVLGLVRGVAWSQIATDASLAVARHAPDARAGSTVAPLAEARDLTSLANAISALVDAPITIESMESTIVAYSSDQERADRSRQNAVLGQKVPEDQLTVLKHAGAFRRIYASTTPVFLSEETAYELPREAIRIVSGTELLGSMWAVVREPFAPSQRAVFVEGARVAAEHLTRSRIEFDAERRDRQQQLAALLGGGEGARTAAATLELASSGFVVCAAKSVDNAGASGVDAARLARVAGALHLHLLTAHPRSLAGVVGTSVYGVLPLESVGGVRPVISEHLRTFVTRSGSRSPVLIAAGDVVHDPIDLHLSRQRADAALAVISSPATARSRTSVRADEVRTDMMLREIHDRWAAVDGVSGIVLDLGEHDQENETSYVATLEAYLDNFGDVRAAASQLIIHPNTCRHRLRRIQELTGIDLADSDQRFDVMLQLRLRRLE